MMWAGEYRQVQVMWLANGILGEFGYISWQVELSMSYVAG